MNSYLVVTSDGDELGHVVERVDGNVIVESGRLRKTRHAIPEVFAHVDDERETVFVSVSRNVVEDSPKVDGGPPDSEEIARFYGLEAEFAPEPETDSLEAGAGGGA